MCVCVCVCVFSFHKFSIWTKQRRICQVASPPGCELHLKRSWLGPKSHEAVKNWSLHRWDGSKGVINFPWIPCAMRSLVSVGHFRNISGHLFTWLVCGSFQWRHGIVSCIVWDDKDKVTGFKRSHWIHLGWWSTGSPKLQLFQLSQHSHVTNCRLISSSAYFPWNVTLKYKMQVSEGSWDKNETF